MGLDVKSTCSADDYDYIFSESEEFDYDDCYLPGYSNVCPPSSLTDESMTDHVSGINCNRRNLNFGKSFSRKRLLQLLLWLVLIMPCGQSVGAHNMVNGTSCVTAPTSMPVGSIKSDIITGTLAFTVTPSKFEIINTALIVHPSFDPGVRSSISSTLRLSTSTTLTANRALILHPFYGTENSVRDLVPVSPTSKALILHPIFGNKDRNTALIPAFTKDTALIVHPYIILSTSKELTVVPPKSFPMCKQISKLPSSLESLLAVIKLDWYYKNQNYSQCMLSDHPNHCPGNRSDELVCPVQNSSCIPEPIVVRYDVTRENGHGGDLLSVTEVAVAILIYFFPLLIIIACRLAANANRKPRSTRSPAPLAKEVNRNHSSTKNTNQKKEADAQNILTSNKPLSSIHTRPNKKPSTTCVPLHDVVNQPSPAQLSFEYCGKEQKCQAVATDGRMLDSPTTSASSKISIDPPTSQPATSDYSPTYPSPSYSNEKPQHSLGECMPSLLTLNSEEQCDSGLGSLQSKLPSLSTQGSGLDLSPITASLHSRNVSFHVHGSLEIGGLRPSSIHSPNYDPKDLIDHEELDVVDEYDVQEDMAYEADLVCLSSDQPMTLNDDNLLKESTDEDEDNRRFEEGILEKELQEQSVLNLITTSPCNDQPITVGEVCAKSELSVTVSSSSPVVIKNSPNSKQKKEIHYLQNSACGCDVQYTSNVDAGAPHIDSQHQSSCTHPPKPPDIDFSLEKDESSMSNSKTFFPVYLPPVEENGISMPGNFQLSTDVTPQPLSASQVPNVEDDSHQANEEDMQHNDPVHHEAERVSTSSDQSSLSDFDCDAGNNSNKWCSCAAECAVEVEDDDGGRFSSGILEEGRQQPIYISVGSLTATLGDDNHPTNAFRGEEDFSNSSSDDESDETHSQQTLQSFEAAMISLVPAPVTYYDGRISHQENEIYIPALQLAARQDLHGRAVIVEPNHFQLDLPAAAALQPKPPDILNTNLQPFLVQNGLSTNAVPTMTVPGFQDYPSPIEEVGTRTTTNTVLVGGMNTSLPRVPSQSVIIVPSLHPSTYINSVVM